MEATLGTCPAATDRHVNGVNDGKNGGRICWASVGTFCGKAIKGTFAKDQLTCMACTFFKQVKEEEGFGKFRVMRPDQLL